MQKLLSMYTLIDIRSKGGFKKFADDELTWQAFGGASGEDEFFHLIDTYYIYGNSGWQAYLAEEDGDTSFFIYREGEWILVSYKM